MPKEFDFITLAQDTGFVVFDTETEGLHHDAGLIGVSMSTGVDEPLTIYMDRRDHNDDEFRETLGHIFSEKSVLKIGHNIKFDIQQLQKFGIEVKGEIFDTLLACWFTDPGNKKLGLKKLAKDLFDAELPTYKETISKHAKGKTLLDVPRGVLEEYAKKDAIYTYKLYHHIKPILDKMPSKELFYQIDMPLLWVLSDMENNGIKIDTAKLKELEDYATSELMGIQHKMKELIGEVNIDSPKQLGGLLFDTMKLKPLKYTKSGQASTDDEVLQRYAKEGNELCKLLVEYRQYGKLIGTYLKALPNKIARDGRIHPSFNVEGTATGRLSCDSPNLQNIPKKGEFGEKIRNCFVPEEGHIFVRADYKQMELRMLAHITRDPYLIYPIRTGQDLHANTARAILGKEELTSEERDRAKAVNFGVVYGMSSFGLQKALGITLQEARMYLNQYFRAYPCVKEWKWEAISRTRDTQEVHNVFGRARPLKADDGALDRLALNTPIQGSCADLVKLAMIRLYEKVKNFKIVLQVHDELLLECKEADGEAVAKLLKDTMESINVVLKPVEFFSICPFEVDVEILHAWKEAE